MLNKRIKSLLVAGLIVVGMSGNAFAYQQDFYEKNDSAGDHAYTSSKIESYVVGENTLDGLVKIVISEDKKYASVEPVKDEYGYDLVRIKHIHVKGGQDHYCYTLEEGESGLTNLSSPLNGGGNIPEISHIIVFYEIVPEDERVAPEDKSDEPEDPTPNPDPEKPEDPGVINPEVPTGDAGIAGLVMAAVAIGTGLAVVNKGKDDEE